MTITKDVLLQKYVKEKKTTREIGQEMDCSHATVSYQLAKFGIPTRGGKHDNLLDKRFGMLTVIGKGNDRGKWLCRCDCGREKEFYRSNFDGGTTQSCSCLKKSSYGPKSRYWKGYKSISGYVWNGIRRAAVDRGLAFEIDIEYAWSLFEKQNGICSLSGEPITLPVSVEKTCEAYNGRWTASLDRIDSQQGYTRGNVQWVHKDVNRIKWTFALPRFLELCRLCSHPLPFSPQPIDDCCSRKRSHWFTGYCCILGKTWQGIKRDAARRGITFALSIEDAWIQFAKQSGLCVITGLPITFNSSWDDPKARTASLDRMDSTVRYRKENVQWVHKDVNIMKGNLDRQRFLFLCERVASNLQL